MSAAADALRVVLRDAGVSAVSTLLRGMTVEGGLAGKMAVLYEALFHGVDQKMPTVVKARSALLKAQGADPQGQLAQLLGLERLLGVVAQERVKETPHFLKALYDFEIVGEDIMIAWSQRASAAKILGVDGAAAQAVRKAAEPVIDWLQQSSEEEDSEEEEEEDDK